MNETLKRFIVNTVMAGVQLLVFMTINTIGFRILGVIVADVPYWTWVLGSSIIFGSFILLWHMKLNWFESK